MALSRKKSNRLFKTAKNYLVGGVNSPVRSFNAVSGNPVFISKAKGSYVFDVDGNKYIDYMSSWGPLILGHSHKDVIASVNKAAKKGTSYGAPCQDEITLSKLVVNSYPSIEKIRMTSSGTEATMSAIRLARAYTGRDFIVKFEGCYHGHADHLLVKAGSGATTFGNPSSPGVPESFTLKTLLAKYNDIKSVERLFKNYKDKIAGVILEPVPGNMGVVLPKPGFLEALRKLTRKNRSLLIFDEVITGFRLSIGGAQKLFNVEPDITCLGKIIGGGLPVGAYGAKAKIMDIVSPNGPMYQAGTLSGNPIAMAAGVATINKLKERGFHKEINKKADYLISGIKDLIEKNNLKATVNSIGSMFTVFFSDKNVVDYKSALSCNTKAFSKFFNELLLGGVMFPPSQFEAIFVSSAHSYRDLEKTLGVIDKSIKNLKQ